MERIRTEILPGVWLTALRTDKFKTAWLSVNLLTQLRRSTAACTAVLPYVLRRGSTRLPDLETIAAELESLYGASITPSVRKLGEIQAVGFEAEFAEYSGVKHCIGVGNGLEALHLLLRAYQVGPGDEVIVPSNTFIATWLAVSECGATPVAVEPNPLTSRRRHPACGDECADPCGR